MVIGGGEVDAFYRGCGDVDVDDTIYNNSIISVSIISLHYMTEVG